VRQCLVAMKDMRDSNCEGKVYELVTRGEMWQMVKYDDTAFRKTNTIVVLFDTMDVEKEKEDCINFALSNGRKMWLIN